MASTTIPWLVNEVLPHDQGLQHDQPRPDLVYKMQGRLPLAVESLLRDFSQDGEKDLVSLGLLNPDFYCYQNSILVMILHYPPLADQISLHHQNFKCLGEDQQHSHPACLEEEACENCCKISVCVLCRLKLMQDVYWSEDDQFDAHVFHKYQNSLHDLLVYTQDEPLEAALDNLPIWHGGDGQADPSEFFEWIKEAVMHQTSGQIASDVWESLFGQITWLSWAKCPNPTCHSHKQERQLDIYGSGAGIEIKDAHKWVRNQNLTDLISKQHTVIQRDVVCDNLSCMSRHRDGPTGRVTHSYFKAVLDFPDLLPVVLRNIISEDVSVEDPKTAKAKRAKGRKVGAKQSKKRIGKASTIVSIPGQLDMSPWWAAEPRVNSKPTESCAPDTHNESFQDVETNREGLVKAKYNLFAVVAHEGTSHRSGHYKTILKNADDQWVELDDLQVSGPFVTAPGEVETHGYPPNLPQRWSAGNWTPYIVFYRRSWDTSKHNGLGPSQPSGDMDVDEESQSQPGSETEPSKEKSKQPAKQTANTSAIPSTRDKKRKASVGSVDGRQTRSTSTMFDLTSERDHKRQKTAK